MREIKFRGKRLDNGEWIYGDLQIGDDDHIPMIGTVGPVSPPVRPRLRRLSNISKRGRNDTSKILYQIQRLR